MAKKRHHTLNKRLTPVHHSSSTEASSSRSKAQEPEPSVQDLIARSRTAGIVQSAEERAREVNAIASSRTVHPSLSSILAVPPPLQPKSRTGKRAIGDVTLGGMTRPPPGPAAPSSWLTASVHAPPELRNLEQKFLEWQADWVRDLTARPQCLTNPITDFPSKKSLEHQALKMMAETWAFQVQYQHHYLSTMPQHLKMRLLGYIAAYGPLSGVGMEGLKALFATEDEIEGATGSEAITSLDLSCSMARSIRFTELLEFMTTQPFQPPKDPAYSKIYAHLNGRNSASTSSEDDLADPQSSSGPSVPDAWDADELMLHHHHLDLTLLVSPQLPMFPSLVHLSLSYPGPEISWWHLLRLAPHIATLTHLSLARWPIPTLIPTISSKPTAPASASLQIYPQVSAPPDWSEARRLVRSLSRTLISLRYLDFTSCGHWTPQVLIAAEWHSGWRLLDTLVLSQGWQPNESLWSYRAIVAAQRERRERIVLERRGMATTPRLKEEGEEGCLWQAEKERWMCERSKEWCTVEEDINEFKEWVRRERSKGGGKWLEVVGSEHERIL